MRSYGQLICDVTAETLSQQPLHQSFSAHALMENISLQVMLKVVFGLHSGERYEQLRNLLPKLLDLLASLVISTPSKAENYQFDRIVRLLNFS